MSEMHYLVFLLIITTNSPIKFRNQQVLGMYQKFLKSLKEQYKRKKHNKYRNRAKK